MRRAICAPHHLNRMNICRRTMTKVTEISAQTQSMTWGYLSNNVKPVAHINSGEIVRLTTLPAGDATKLHPDPARVDPLHREAVETLHKGRGAHFITGPVFVRNAEPGDVLQIDILSIHLTQDWGRVSTVPLLGALPEDFSEPKDIYADINHSTNSCALPWGVNIPLDPFFGLIATAPPPQWKECDSNIPRSFGGNLDNKELRPGSTLYLPVFNEGALFSAGDAHGVQGDGEVCVAGLETGAVGEFRLTVRKDMKLSGPFAESKTHLISMGLHEELAVAARAAIRQMIDQICSASKMTRTEAYMLCSLAGNLRITQLVDWNKGVHMMLRKSLLPGQFS